MSSPMLFEPKDPPIFSPHIERTASIGMHPSFRLSALIIDDLWDKKAQYAAPNAFSGRVLTVLIRSGIVSALRDLVDIHCVTISPLRGHCRTNARAMERDAFPQNDIFERRRTRWSQGRWQPRP